MTITDDLIRKAASAIIRQKLIASNIYPKEGTEPLDEIPESVREEVMDSAEAVLQVVRDHLAGCPIDAEIPKKDKISKFLSQMDRNLDEMRNLDT